MKGVILASLLLLPLALRGQAIDTMAFEKLSQAIIRFHSSDLMRHGTLGVSIRNRESGESLLALNDEKSLPPASTIKLATTAAALEVLGEQFVFETYLEYDGTLSNGILNGNLYIRGTGDPTLGSPRFKDRTDSATVFNDWLQALRKAKIRQVNGHIYADMSHFESPGVSEAWLLGDIGNGYAAGAYSLNWNENICRLYFKPGSRTGEPAGLLRVEPETYDVRYLNKVTTGLPGSGDKTRIQPIDQSGNLLITGTVPRVRAEFSIKGSIFNPGALIASNFKYALNANQIEVKGSAQVLPPSAAPKTRKLLHTYRSPSLPEICRQVNWWSVNIYAESILKAMTHKLTGKTDFQSAAETLTGFWVVKGVPAIGMSIRDGSGLAGTALLTPRNLSDILNTASLFDTFPVFFETIAIAGESGTVRSKRFGTKSNTRAKSGSIGGTRAYAGYINTGTGQRLSFVINANRFPPDSSSIVVRELTEIVRLMGDL